MATSRGQGETNAAGRGREDIFREKLNRNKLAR
jgi:hypothetical protein